MKQSGFPYLIRRTVDCSCPGDAIPAAIEVDISDLNLGQTVLLPQLKVPEGVRIVALVRVAPSPSATTMLLYSNTKSKIRGYVKQYAKQRA